MTPSVVKGYRSALAQIFGLRGLDLSKSPEIGALFKNFRSQLPRRECRLPNWDLSLVLKSLTRAPYEPLSAASDRDLTLKTVFLLAFASAKRVGELHGLSRVVSHTRGWSSAGFSYAPDFVAKTQRPEDSSFAGTFSIPSLSDFVGGDRDEMLLCPVRCLREYIRRMEPLRPRSSSRLFLTTGRTKKEVSKNSISLWIRHVIRRAYTLANSTDLSLCKVSARDVRAISTSLLFLKNKSLAQIMSAAQWRCTLTFVTFYLRNVMHQYQDICSLGPVVAAQSTL